MRKKFSKIAKKALALGLSLGMLASTTVFAASSNAQDTIESPTTFQDYTYDVILPTKYNVAIDQYQRNATTTSTITYLSQIYTEPFVILNASDIPVKVTIYPYITASGTSVNIKTKAADVATGTSTSKDLFIEARPISAGTISLSGIASGSAVRGSENDEGIITPNRGATINVKKFTDDNSNKSANLGYIASGYALSDGTTNANTVTGFSFVLDKTDYTDFDEQEWGSVLSGTAFNKDNAAGFKLIGKLNNNASWKSGDFSVKIVYNLEGYSAHEFANATRSAAEANVLTTKAVSVASLGATTRSSTKSATLRNQENAQVKFSILKDDLEYPNPSEHGGDLHIYKTVIVNSEGSEKDITRYTDVTTGSAFDTVTIYQTKKTGNESFKIFEDDNAYTSYKLRFYNSEGECIYDSTNKVNDKDFDPITLKLND